MIDMSPYYSAHADQQMLLDFLFRTDGFGCNKAATVLINHGSPESKYELCKAVQMRGEDRRGNDRQIKEIRIADARWLNLDTGEVIEQSCPHICSQTKAYLPSTPKPYFPSNQPLLVCEQHIKNLLLKTKKKQIIHTSS